MNATTCTARSVSGQKPGRALAVGLTVLLTALPLFSADQRGGGGGAMRAPAAPRAMVVDRSSHGSVRHADAHIVQRPAEVRPLETRPEPGRTEPVRQEPGRPEVVRPGFAPPRGVVVNRDRDADVHRAHGWDDFAFGRRLRGLPVGFLAMQIAGAPYYYCDGIYYQQADDGYQEVYPPVGAELSEPPDGAIEIDAGGGQVYYYAGGAFYAQQPDGGYAIVPAPIGVVVPELPPGAAQIAINGILAYQFNGVDYEPVFVNGVTQYQTFMP
jgi:hypothetical protein